MLRSFRPLVYGLNSFAGAALALLVGLLVGLPIPYWAMSTAFIVSHPLSGATRSKAVYRVFGTVIGATVAIIMVPAMAEAPVLLTLGLSAWLGVCLFFSMLDRSPRSYVVMLAGYTAAMIAFPSVDAPQMVWDTAVARVTEITLGIVCATFVHSVFWPQSVGNVLRAKARGWLRDASQWLLDCVDNAEIEQLGADRRHLAVDAVDLKILATHLPFDTSHLADTTRTVRALLGRMLLLLPLLSGLSDRRVALGGPLAPDMAALFARVRDWIDRGIPEGEASALAAATAELARTHDASDWRGQISTALLVRLEQAIGTVDICHRISRHLDDPAPAQDAELQALIASSPSPGSTRHDDRFTAGISALSAAAALGACCLFWIATGWADGAGAAVMTAVFCCLFAAQDNPMQGILRFGIGTLLSIALSGVYMVEILPHVQGYGPLVLSLSPVLVLAGMFSTNPRWAIVALSFQMGVCTLLALQESANPDFERFLNSSVGEMVAMGFAVFFTTTVRRIGNDGAISRLRGAMHADLARVASARTPPNLEHTLARTADRLALLTPRLALADQGSPGRRDAEEGLRGLRIALNLAVLQNLRTQMERSPRAAISRVLKTVAAHFGALPPVRRPPGAPAALLEQIDLALGRLAISQEHHRAEAIATLVALRRNLFPQASASTPLPAPPPPPPADGQTA